MVSMMEAPGLLQQLANGCEHTQGVHLLAISILHTIFCLIAAQLTAVCALLAVARCTSVAASLQYQSAALMQFALAIIAALCKLGMLEPQSVQC